MAGEMAEEMAVGKEWEMVCTAGTVGSAENTPGHQRSGPAGQQTRISAKGGRKPSR